MLEWAKANYDGPKGHKLVGNGTTGGIIAKELQLEVTRFKSGPLCGDQQIGALIAEQNLDLLILFWDPLNPAPHDPDVKALPRLCSARNVPVACTEATADLIITSPLLPTQATQEGFQSFKHKDLITSLYLTFTHALPFRGIINGTFSVFTRSI